MNGNIPIMDLLIAVAFGSPMLLLFYGATIYLKQGRNIASILFFIGAAFLTLVISLFIAEGILGIRISVPNSMKQFLALTGVPIISIGVFLQLRRHLKLLNVKETIDDIKGIDNE